MDQVEFVLWSHICPSPVASLSCENLFSPLAWNSLFHLQAPVSCFSMPVSPGPGAVTPSLLMGGGPAVKKGWKKNLHWLMM